MAEIQCRPCRQAIYQDELLQRQWMFGFDSAERADRKSAAGVALQMLDMGPCACAGFFQRLHRTVAVFAAHNFVPFGEGFVDGARQPTAPYFDLALGHHRRFLPGSHPLVRCFRPRISAVDLLALRLQ